MKKRDITVSILIFFFVSVVHVSCEQQKAEWKGTIEDEDGAKIIKNPNEPIYGEIEFELKEDLSIGNEEDENYMFYLRDYYGVKNVALDSKENIYVLDSGNFRVQKYDKNGHYLQTIGSKGQGPGEFIQPSYFHIDDKDNLYILDRREIKIISSSGEFRKSIYLEIPIQNFFVTYEGDILARINAANEREEAIVKFNKEGEFKEYLAKFSDIEPSIRKGSRKGSYIIFTAFHDYTPRAWFSPSNGQSFTYGFPLKYELYVSDNLGNLKMRIQKKERYHSISQAEKSKIINELNESISSKGQKWPERVLEEACQFPPYCPFFDRFLVDDKGRIYVRKLKSVLDRTERIEFDIFSKDGYYFYQTTLSISPEIIKNGYLYNQYTSEETGEVKIKRYKVKNWKQIRY